LVSFLVGRGLAEEEEEERVVTKIEKEK